MRIQWAARRAEGGAGGDGGAWLDGDAARAMACDAAITPVVTGDLDPAPGDRPARSWQHRLRAAGVVAADDGCNLAQLVALLRLARTLQVDEAIIELIGGYCRDRGHDRAVPGRPAREP